MSLPTTNITTSMVSSAIGLGSNNVGALCSSSNINKWAKYKPVPLYSNTTTGINDWWKSGNCGISYPTYSTVADLKSAYNVAIAWGHNHPTGGYSSPYRLGDFRGYNHTAVFQVNAFDVPPTIYNIATQINVSIGLRSQASDELLLSDICGDYYLGVLLVSNTGYNYLITSSTKTKDLSTLSDSFTVPIVSNVNNYTAYPVICTEGSISTQYPDNVLSTTGATLIPIHGQISKQANVITAYQISWQNHVWNGLHNVNYSILLVNNTQSVVTFNNIKVAVKWGTSAYADALRSGETLVNIGNIDVAANSTYTLSGTLDAEKSEYGGDWKLWFNSTYPELLQSITI